jgi:hypothetical protein
MVHEGQPNALTRISIIGFPVANSCSNDVTEGHNKKLLKKWWF